MPLQDHFHPPLALQRHWHSFHNSWATYLASALNAQLPANFFAEANVQFGIEIDVATFEGNGGAGHGASWSPPAPTLTLPLVVATDIVEVRVFNQEAGPVLAAAIELVSPANKDREENRDAFVSKCATYLQTGVGLIVVDVVTDRRADLHTALLERVSPAADRTPDLGALYAAAYRPVIRDERTEVDIWHRVQRVGTPLPSLPLWIKGGPCLQVDLEAAYDRTCREQRVPTVS